VRSRIVFWANLAIGAAIFAYLMVAYGDGALAVLRLDVSMPWLAAYLCTTAASIVCLSWRWGYVLRGLAPSPGIVALTLYRSAGHSLAVLVPSGKLGGDPLRAYLAVRGGVSAPHAIASTGVDRTLEIAASAPFSILFASLLLQHGVPQLGRALLTVIVATAALGVGVFLAVRRLRRSRGLVSALVKAMGVDRWAVVDSQMGVIEASEESAAALSADRGRMWATFAIGLFANLLVVAEFTLLLHAFGLPDDTVAIVGAIFATGAAHMLPVPAGVGVLEGGQMWLFEMLGYGADVGLAVGLVVRLRELLWMAPGLVYLALRALRTRNQPMPAA